MDGGAWWATVHGVTKSQTRLSDFTSLHFTSLQGLLMKGSYVCKEQHKLIALLLQFPGEKSLPPSFNKENNNSYFWPFLLPFHFLLFTFLPSFPSFLTPPSPMIFPCQKMSSYVEMQWRVLIGSALSSQIKR